MPRKRYRCSAMARRSSGTPCGWEEASRESARAESTSRMSLAQVEKGNRPVSTPLVEKS